MRRNGCLTSVGAMALPAFGVVVIFGWWFSKQPPDKQDLAMILLLVTAIFGGILAFVYGLVHALGLHAQSIGTAASAAQPMLYQPPAIQGHVIDSDPLPQLNRRQPPAATVYTPANRMLGQPWYQGNGRVEDEETDL